jgi:Fic family protein
MLDLYALNALQLPLAACQQLAELRFWQGQHQTQPTLSPDLLAGMAVTSQRAAIEAMRSEPRAAFDYARCLNFLPSLTSNQHLTSEHIRQLHQQLHAKGGRWRQIKLKIERRDQPGDRLLIETCKPSPETAVETAVEQLQLALTAGIEPLVIIPLFALRLMQLFPFLDGNKRLTLLLTRQLLSTHGLSVLNHVDLESEVMATEKIFFRALHQSQHPHTVTPWLSYWWVLLKRLYQRFDQQVQHANINPGRGSKTALVEHFVAMQQQPFQLSDACQSLPTLSPDLIRIALRGLRDRQIICSQGRGRGARWEKCKTQ